QGRGVARPRRRRIVRALQGYARPRPRLRRGFVGRCRCQLRHDRLRRHRRGAGDGRDRAVHAGRLRPAAGARQEGHRRADLAAEVDGGVTLPLPMPFRHGETGTPRRAIPMTPTGVLETVLYARDLAAAEAFYREALGLDPFARVEGRHLFYRCGDQVLLIFNPDATRIPPAPGALPVPPHGMDGEGHVCFRASAAEIGQWRQRLQARGVAIEADFEWPGGGRSIYFRDPAGNCLEFAEPRIWKLA